MIGCRTRGYSFTRALLGISADELHLCGDPAVVPLIEEILKVTGDSLKACFPSWCQLFNSFFFFFKSFIHGRKDP